MTRDAIRFLLGDQPRELRGFDPTLTVLDWLRTQERRNGTKEGCNEGDCGACTVVLAHPQAGRLHYRAVNACIQFVGTLDGCQLLTVEDLKAPDGSLHAVQQAMVDCHGSQCGFCTPGFVMSLFAMTKNEACAPDADRINDILAGNLCRCTGYAPIARAAVRAYDLGPGDRHDAHEAATIERLAALDDGASVKVTSAKGSFFSPATLEQLADILLEHPTATIVAGSTDVGLWVTKQMRPLQTLVWLGRVRELQEIRETPEALEIGAAVTYTQALDTIRAHYADLGEMARRLGSVQVRNAGTIGGNIANGSPIGDGSPALIAAGATLHLRHGAERRAMPLEDFFLAYGKQDRRPGEFVERISLPKPAPGTRYRAYKVSKRFDQDISAVLGAFLLRFDGDIIAEARIAFGGMAATPKRAFNAEAALVGGVFSEARLHQAHAALDEDFKPIGDMRASAAYRMRVAKNLMTRLRFEVATADTRTRLVGDRRLAHA